MVIRTAVPIRAASELPSPAWESSSCRPRAFGEPVEARAHEPAACQPAEDDGHEQADDEQQQGAADPRQERAQLVAGALDHSGDHGRRSVRVRGSAGDRGRDRCHDAAERA